MICLHHPDSRDFSPEEIISSFEMRLSAKNGRRMLAAAAITAALGITLIAISFALTIPPRALSLPFDKVQIGMSLDEVTQTLRHPPGNYSFSHYNPPQSKYGFKCWVCDSQ